MSEASRRGPGSDSHNAHRTALCALIICLGCVSSVSALEDRYAADPALRRFVDSQHGEAVAIELSRLVSNARHLPRRIK